MKNASITNASIIVDAPIVDNAVDAISSVAASHTLANETVSAPGTQVMEEDDTNYIPLDTISSDSPSIHHDIIDRAEAEGTAGAEQAEFSSGIVTTVPTVVSVSVGVGVGSSWVDRSLQADFIAHEESIGTPVNQAVKPVSNVHMLSIFPASLSSTKGSILGKESQVTVTHIHLQPIHVKGRVQGLKFCTIASLVWQIFTATTLGYNRYPLGNHCTTSGSVKHLKESPIFSSDMNISGAQSMMVVHAVLQGFSLQDLGHILKFIIVQSGRGLDQSISTGGMRVLSICESHRTSVIIVSVAAPQSLSIPLLIHYPSFAGISKTPLAKSSCLEGRRGQ